MCALVIRALLFGVQIRAPDLNPKCKDVYTCESDELGLSHVVCGPK